MTQGDIWMVRLPVTAGREQSGERPAVILQDEIYAQTSPLVLIVPLTSSLGALRFPATKQIEPTAENGLSVASVAMVFQVRALDRSRFVRNLGSVSSEDMADLLTELNNLTGQ